MPEADPNLPALVVEGGALDGFTMNISEGETIVVGSGRLANLRVDHPDIELAHVKVTWDNLGIAMRDNGSRHGTWVDNEKVESAALIDGDVIAFMPPDSPSSAPRIRMRIPEGTVPEAPPLPPTEEGAPAEGEASTEAPAPTPEPTPKPTPRRKRKKGPAVQISPRLLAIVGGGLAVAVVGAWVVSRFLFSTAPTLASLTPSRAEVGATLTLRGEGFASDAESNTVWFGNRSARPQSVSPGTVQVAVPAMKAGTVAVSVETSGGRSGTARFEVLAPLTAATLDPPGALPGDEVVARGQGFDGETLTVTVGGVEAAVVAAEPGALRFTMPPLEAAPGSEHPVVVTVDGRAAPPLNLVLGRLPLVASFEPARAVAGERVRLRGLGFSDVPAGNAVTFDDVPALVLSSTRGEIEVVAPVPLLAQRETLAQVVVQAGGKISAGVGFPLLRLTSGAYILHFFAGSGGPAPGPAFVETEVGPVMMLAWKGTAPSVAHRAMEVAEAINAVVKRPRRGERPVFEAREEPSIGVGLAGGPGLVLRASPQDAAAYERPPGLPARGGPPTPLALARWWAAVLNDYVVITTSPGQPSHVAALSPAAGATMTRLRSALPWQYRSRVPNERVANLPADLKRRVREAALQVP